MANRRLTCVLPPVTPRQHPIEGVEIAFRVDASFPWTVQTTVLVTAPQELFFQDVPVGDIFYRGVVVDIMGARSNDAVISAFGAFDPPGSLTNFIATEE